jgi:hypothetical protein
MSGVKRAARRRLASTVVAMAITCGGVLAEAVPASMRPQMSLPSFFPLVDYGFPRVAAYFGAMGRPMDAGAVEVGEHTATTA